MTRANVYVMDNFIGEVGSDAYPGGDFWAMMLEMNNSKQSDFEKNVKEEIESHWGKSKLPPKSGGVGNWSYEFMWVPKTAPNDYTDWDNWEGEVYVRKYQKMCGYYQLPDKWVPIAEFEDD